MLKERSGPLPVAEGGFVVGIDTTAELAVFAFAGHLTIEQGENAAANIVGVTMRVETKVNEVGVEVVLEVKLLVRTKSMQ